VCTGCTGGLCVRAYWWAVCVRTGGLCALVCAGSNVNKHEQHTSTNMGLMHGPAMRHTVTGSTHILAVCYQYSQTVLILAVCYQYSQTITGFWLYIDLPASSLQHLHTRHLHTRHLYTCTSSTCTRSTQLWRFLAAAAACRLLKRSTDACEFAEVCTHVHTCTRTCTRTCMCSR
jgi:hypothetical protein